MARNAEKRKKLTKGLVSGENQVTQNAEYFKLEINPNKCWQIMAKQTQKMMPRKTKEVRPRVRGPHGKALGAKHGLHGAFQFRTLLAMGDGEGNTAQSKIWGGAHGYGSVRRVPDVHPCGQGVAEWVPGVQMDAAGKMNWPDWWDRAPLLTTCKNWVPPGTHKSQFLLYFCSGGAGCLVRSEPPACNQNWGPAVQVHRYLRNANTTWIC